MVRIQGPIFVAVVLLTSVVCTPVEAQQPTGLTRHQRIAASILRRKAASGIKDSVRQQAVEHAAVAAKKSAIQTPVGALQEMLPEGSIAPPTPAPAAGLDIGSAATEIMSSDPFVDSAGPPVPPSTLPTVDSYPSSVQSAVEYPASNYPVAAPAESVSSYPASGYPAESYPVTPHQPLGVPQSDIVYEDPFSTPISHGGCDGGCGGACGGGCAAGPTCGAPGVGGCGGCAGCGGAYGGGRFLDSMSIGLGVHGYKNMINRGDSGSFGFQESLNWGSPFISPLLQMNSQLGFRATQTDFSGSSFTADSRSQFFVTGGFYKRNYNGWQGGFVLDYLHDDWYTTIDMAQIRGELSYAVPNGSSVGLTFATNVAGDETTSLLNGATFDEEWETHDIYTFFYEVQSNQNRRGKWRVWVGFTGESDGIIGSNFKIPLAGTWSLEPEFTYLVSDEPTGGSAQDEEAWNVAVNMVWYPGRAFGNLNYRRLPLFDVAGNGSMISRRK